MIPASKKPCEGINKAKGFSGCGVPTFKRVNGLCPKCLREWSKSTPEGIEYVIKRIIPRAKKQVKEEIKHEKTKAKINSIDWAFRLQESINSIIRLIDHGQPCLARRYHASTIHAGHVYSRGAESSMKYNLHNIHRQSAQSNHFQNEDGLLREGLISEYGIEYFNFITSMRATPVLKYTNEEYHEFHIKALKIANTLKRNGELFSLDERIQKRNEINMEIGIYEKEFSIFVKR